MEGFTVDGNAVVNTAWFEVGVGGANSIIRNMQIINSAGNGHLALSGANCRATGNTVTGLGTHAQHRAQLWCLGAEPRHGDDRP